MIGPLKRGVWQLDLLYDFTVAGRREPQPLDLVGVDFVVAGGGDPFRRQRLAQLPGVSGLAPPGGMRPSAASPLGPQLSDSTGRRLGRRRGVFRRLGQRQLEFGHPLRQALNLRRLLGHEGSQFLDHSVSPVHRRTVAK